MPENRDGDNSVAQVSREIKDLFCPVEDMLRLAAEGFESFRSKSPQKTVEMEKNLTGRCERMLANLVSMTEKQPEARKNILKPHITAVNHLIIIVGCSRDFAEQVIVKIKEGLLFSDKAYREINELYIEVASLMHQAFAIFEHRDSARLPEIESKAAETEKLIDCSSSEHEKRLITGICNVRSSALFLDMLDALRRIAGHAVCISRAV
jgi:phosphate:Na+ symporter